MTTEQDLQTPGTWRVSDGAAVPFKEAKAQWVAYARQVLIRTASRYHAYVTYGELAAEVQQLSGVRTRSQMRNWIGSVLKEVADECHHREEPALTSLCVRQDETVGDGYSYVIELARQDPAQDLDLRAAEDRLACYQHWGASLPSGGGRPALPPRLIAARRRAAGAAARPATFCPRCFTQLPASGQCDHCD